MNENHNVIVNNGLADMRIRLDEKLDAWCQNLSFPHLPEIRYNDHLAPEGCLDIIWMLQQVPAVEFPDRFQNRWEEIKTITMGNLALNIDWQKGNTNEGND